MSLLVAIHVGEGNAEVVTAESSATGELNIVSATTLEIPGTAASMNGAGTAHVDDTSREAEEELEGSEEPRVVAEPPKKDELSLIEQFLEGEDVEAMLASFRGQGVLHENLELPFNDPKKLEQIVPIQVQDLVPFDLDDFIIDSVIVGDGEDDSYNILASLAPEKSVADSLAQLKALGADPKLLTTKGAATTLLARHPEIAEYKTFAFLTLSEDCCSLALFVEGHLKSFREFSGDFHDILSNDSKAIWRDIKCSIAGLEKSIGERLEQVFFCGPRGITNTLAVELGYRLVPINLSAFCSKAHGVRPELHELAWAVGLFTGESTKTANAPIINFRHGSYAYKPLWGNFVSAIKDESTSVILAGIFLLSWVFILLYSNHSSLSRIEDTMSEQLAKTFPNEIIPPRGEVMFVQNQLVDVEEQLKGLGSLSSLSPLDSLRELSDSVTEDIDIQVSKITIRHDGLSLNGSVKDVPAIGRLETALQERDKHFCEVRVDARGSMPGSARRKVQAEILFCN